MILSARRMILSAYAAAALFGFWPWPSSSRTRGLDFLRTLFPMERYFYDEPEVSRDPDPPMYHHKTVHGITPPSRRSLKGGRRK